MTPQDAAIALSGASKSFGARKALKGVALSIAPGEMTVLIGPSGSGKSTLLRALAGLVRLDPGGGEVRILGRVLQANGRLARDVRATRARVGFVFQQFNLVGRLSLFGNVALGALGRIGFWRGLLGLWPAQVRADVLAALERVGVGEQAAQRANTLSGGQQQRAAIARALVQQARIVLADEPIASLDPVTAQRVLDLLAELNRRDGLTVVVTLHQVDLAMRYGARIIALRDGEIAFDGPPTALKRETLQAIYGNELSEAFSAGAAP